MRFTIAFIIGRFALHGPSQAATTPVFSYRVSLIFHLVWPLKHELDANTPYAQRAPMTTLYLRPIHARVATQDEIWERQRGGDEGRARDWAKGRGKGGDAHLSVSWDHVTYYGALPLPTPKQSLFLPCLVSGSTRQAEILNIYLVWNRGYELTILAIEKLWGRMRN